MTLDDTSAKAREVYLERLAAMTVSDRIRVGLALWEAGHALQRAAILHENPLASEAEILFRIAASRFGHDVARRLYGKAAGCP